VLTPALPSCLSSLLFSSLSVSELSPLYLFVPPTLSCRSFCSYTLSFCSLRVYLYFKLCLIVRLSIIYLSFCMYICLSVYMCICLCIDTCFSICLSVLIRVCLSVLIRVCLSVLICVNLSVLINVFLSHPVSLFLWPSISIYPSVYRSVSLPQCVCMCVCVCVCVREWEWERTKKWDLLLLKHC
jgi:hypothetical protein